MVSAGTKARPLHPTPRRAAGTGAEATPEIARDDAPSRSIRAASNNHCASKLLSCIFAQVTSRPPTVRGTLAATASPPPTEDSPPASGPPSVGSILRSLGEDTEGTIRGDELWRAVEYRFTLAETLELRAEQSLLLDSSKLFPLAHESSQFEIVPIPGLGGRDSIVTIKVTSVEGTRNVPRLNADSVEYLTGCNPAESQFDVVIPLTRSELLSSPTVTVETRSATAQPLDIRASLGQLRPVSDLHAQNTTPSTMPLLRVFLPEYATSNIAGLLCELNWASEAREVRGALEEAESIDESGRAKSVYFAVSGSLDRVKASTEALHRRIDESAQALLMDAGRRNTATPSEWRAEVASALETLSEWDQAHQRKKLRKLSLAGIYSAGMDWANLLDQLRPRFVLLSEVDQASGEIDLAALEHSLGDSLSDVARFSSIRVPFTTENEPGTLGKRSSVVLAGLGILLLLTTLVDTSWLSIGNGPTEELAGTLRDPLVALLLVFPAALYAQFFQSRPRSPIGIRAQMATFAILSLVFALPAAPAIAAAVGWDLRAVSILCFVCAAVAFGTSVWLWLSFSDDRLRKMRLKAILEAPELRAGPDGKLALPTLQPRV